MGTHWSRSQGRPEEDRILVSTSSIIARTAIKKCFGRICESFEAESSTDIRSTTVHVDYLSASIASDIEEGLFHAVSPGTSWGSSLMLMDIVHRAALRLGADAWLKPSTKKSPPSPQCTIALIPTMNRVGTTADAHVQISVRAARDQGQRYISKRMNSLVQHAVHIVGPGPLPDAAESTTLQEKESSPVNQSTRQARVHHVLRQFTRGTLCYRDAYLKIYPIVCQWIQAVEFNTIAERHRWIASMSSAGRIRRFAFRANPFTLHVPVAYFKKKKRGSVRHHCNRAARAPRVPAPAAHRMPVGAGISPLSIVPIVEEQWANTETSSGDDPLFHHDVAPLPLLTLELPPPATVAAEQEVFCLNDNGTGEGTTRTGARHSQATSSNHHHPSNLLEGLFGKIKFSEGLDSSSPATLDDLIPSRSARVPPMCVEPAGALSPPCPSFDLEDNNFKTLQLPPLIPPGLSQQPSHSGEDRAMSPLGSTHMRLAGTACSAGSPFQSSAARTPHARPPKKQTRRLNRTKKKEVGRKRRRQKAMETIDPSEHIIPASSNKGLDLWHTDPTTNRIVPGKWFCHIRSCYAGKTKPKSYSTFAVLQQHYKYHIMLPMHCPLCNESFSSPGSRDTHIKKQHRNGINPGAAPPAAKRRKSLQSATPEINLDHLFSL